MTSLGFDGFKREVRAMGGVWADSVHVFFTQFRDGYGASYRPYWPERTPEDQAISYNWLNDRWRCLSPEEYNREYDSVEQMIHERGVL